MFTCAYHLFYSCILIKNFIEIVNSLVVVRIITETFHIEVHLAGSPSVNILQN